MNKILSFLIFLTSIFFCTYAFASGLGDRIAMGCYFFYSQKESDKYLMNIDEVNEWNKGGVQGLYNIYSFTLFLQDNDDKNKGFCTIATSHSKKCLKVSRDGNTLFFTDDKCNA